MHVLQALATHISTLSLVSTQICKCFKQWPHTFRHYLQLAHRFAIASDIGHTHSAIIFSQHADLQVWPNTFRHNLLLARRFAIASDIGHTHSAIIFSYHADLQVLQTLATHLPPLSLVSTQICNCFRHWPHTFRHYLQLAHRFASASDIGHTPSAIIFSQHADLKLLQTLVTHISPLSLVSTQICKCFRHWPYIFRHYLQLARRFAIASDIGHTRSDIIFSWHTDLQVLQTLATHLPPLSLVSTQI